MDEVKQHKTGESICWTVLKGRVYNISPYMKFHPGGMHGFNFQFLFQSVNCISLTCQGYCHTWIHPLTYSLCEDIYWFEQNTFQHFVYDAVFYLMSLAFLFLLLY